MCMHGLAFHSDVYHFTPQLIVSYSFEKWHCSAHHTVMLSKCIGWLNVRTYQPHACNNTLYSSPTQNLLVYTPPFAEYHRVSRLYVGMVQACPYWNTILSYTLLAFIFGTRPSKMLETIGGRNQWCRMAKLFIFFLHAVCLSAAYSNLSAFCVKGCIF